MNKHNLFIYLILILTEKGSTDHQILNSEKKSCGTDYDTRD